MNQPSELSKHHNFILFKKKMMIDLIFNISRARAFPTQGKLYELSFFSLSCSLLRSIVYLSEESQGYPRTSVNAAGIDWIAPQRLPW